MEEFWIFLEQDVSTSTATAAAMMTSPSSSFPSGYPKTGSTSGPSTSSIPTPSELPLEEEGDNPVPTPSPWYGPKGRLKRGTSTTPAPFPASSTHPSFPRLIKMVEKRKPHENIEPYCQQMQVLDNWQVVAIPGVDVIEIEEEEFEDYAVGTGKRRRSISGISGQSLAKRDEQEIIQDLESLCICEWRAG